MHLICSPSMQHHVDGRPTYNGVWSGCPRGSFTTLLSVHKCHVAFSSIPSTLAWVDQSPVIQRVLQQPSSGYTVHNCYSLPRYPGLVEWESTIPRGTAEELDLWEAGGDPLQCQNMKMKAETFRKCLSQYRSGATEDAILQSRNVGTVSSWKCKRNIS